MDALDFLEMEMISRSEPLDGARVCDSDRLLF